MQVMENTKRTFHKYVSLFFSILADFKSVFIVVSWLVHSFFGFFFSVNNLLMFSGLFKFLIICTIVNFFTDVPKTQSSFSSSFSVSRFYTAVCWSSHINQFDISSFLSLRWTDLVTCPRLVDQFHNYY